jgi:Zn-dependent protease
MLGALFRPWPLGRLLGIPVRVVPLAIVLFATPVLLVAGSGDDALARTSILLGHLVFALLLHEFGHALVARRLGLHVVDVTIWPLVGMARIEGLAARPALEAPVAAAGPAVNLLLAGALALTPWTWSRAGIGLNLVFGIGNLLPLYPLDGGRIVRAWLARRSPLVDATRAAIPPFWLLLALLIALGWWIRSWLVPVLTGLYLASSASGDLMRTVLQFGLPRWSRAETWRRSFARAERSDAGASAAGAETDAGCAQPAGGPAREVEAELQDFRGPLREFFRRR